MSSMSEPEIQSVLEELESTRARFERIRAELNAVGIERVENLAAEVRRVDGLLDGYEDRATGTGDFAGYVAFRDEVSSLVEGLPDDFPHREDFEEVDEIVDQRRLSTHHFEQAREALSDARDFANRLEDLAEARSAYRSTRQRVNERINELDARLEELDRALRMADVDLDAPIHELREPIDRYNAAVDTAFDRFLMDHHAVDVLDLFALTDRYPLVPMPAPPTELHSYVTETVPTLTIHELLEYASFSRSKLAHYVDDPQAFKAAVAPELTYLEGLDADPFTVSWPPPSSDRLSWTIRELIPVVDRFAPASVLEQLRSVRALTRDTERFERLQRAARAHEELPAAHRRRLRSGELESEREAVLHAKQRLESALDEHQ